MSMAKPVAVAGILAMAVAAVPAVAQVRPGQDSAARRTWGVNPGPAGAWVGRRAEALADTAFIREATTGNVLEVRLSELALSRADDSEVKDFARRMVKDHGAMQEQWDALIRRNGLPVEASLAPAEEREVSRLEGLSGRAFDRAYIAAMIRDHRRDAGTFQRMEPSLQSSDVRRLAASGLNTIQEHLTMAQQVGRRAGESSDRAEASRPSR